MKKNNNTYPYKLLEDKKELAKLGFWNKEVYGDLIACQSGKMAQQEFHKKYSTKLTILCLDISGFTETSMHVGELQSFYNILNVQKVCVPIFQKNNARQIKAFADNLTVIFNTPHDALRTSFDIHRSIQKFNECFTKEKYTPKSCIGIGYGNVYAIGFDSAMGKEMNIASKLGEEIAKGFETLITESTYNALKDKNKYRFQKHKNTTHGYKYYKVFKL